MSARVNHNLDRRAFRAMEELWHAALDVEQRYGRDQDGEPLGWSKWQNLRVAIQESKIALSDMEKKLARRDQNKVSKRIRTRRREQ